MNSGVLAVYPPLYITWIHALSSDPIDSRLSRDRASTFVRGVLFKAACAVAVCVLRRGSARYIVAYELLIRCAWCDRCKRQNRLASKKSLTSFARMPKPCAACDVPIARTTKCTRQPCGP